MSFLAKVLFLAYVLVVAAKVSNSFFNININNGRKIAKRSQNEYQVLSALVLNLQSKFSQFSRNTASLIF